MDYRKAKVGVKVTFTKDTDMAAKGDTGFINELRGYNRLGRKIYGRYVFVWVTRNVPAIGSLPAHLVERNCNATTEVLELI